MLIEEERGEVFRGEGEEPKRKKKHGENGRQNKSDKIGE